MHPAPALSELCGFMADPAQRTRSYWQASDKAAQQDIKQHVMGRVFSYSVKPCAVQHGSICCRCQMSRFVQTGCKMPNVSLWLPMLCWHASACGGVPFAGGPAASEVWYRQWVLFPGTEKHLRRCFGRTGCDPEKLELLFLQWLLLLTLKPSHTQAAADQGSSWSLVRWLLCQQHWQQEDQMGQKLKFTGSLLSSPCHELSCRIGALVLRTVLQQIHCKKRSRGCRRYSSSFLFPARSLSKSPLIVLQ